MTTTAAIRKQLAALLAIVKPPHSLESRLEKLSAEHREIYGRYSDSMAEFIERCKAQPSDDIEPDARAYARVIDGYGPRLPDAVSKALHGPMPQILSAMTDEQAAQIWLDEVSR